MKLNKIKEMTAQVSEGTGRIYSRRKVGVLLVLICLISSSAAAAGTVAWSTPDTFGATTPVEYHNGKVFTFDYDNNAIEIYDSSDGSQLSSFSPTHMDVNYGRAVTTNYVAVYDGSTDEWLIYDHSGNLAQTITVDSPNEVDTVDMHSGTLYIVERTSFESYIEAYDISDGSQLFSWSSENTGEFHRNIRSLDYNPSDGDVYYTVRDSNNDDIFLVRLKDSSSSDYTISSTFTSGDTTFTRLFSEGSDVIVYDSNNIIYTFEKSDLSYTSATSSTSLSQDYGDYLTETGAIYTISGGEGAAIHSDGTTAWTTSEVNLGMAADGETRDQDSIYAYDTASNELKAIEGPLSTLPPVDVSGTVTDQDDEPISNVSVEISDSTSGEVLVTTTTEEDGEYSVELAGGDYVANFSKSGYSSAEETFTVAGEPVTVNAQLVEERLRLESRQLFAPGATHEYRVIFETADESGNAVGTDVTDSATVTSSNTSILTVDQGQQTMTAVDDENVSQVVTVNMSYQTYSGQAKIVVAEATVDNLAILPTGLSRGQAVMLDDFIFALLIAAFLSVPASRFANAFAGLGVAEMVIVVGWLGGFVPLGIAMLSIFMAMFVGLNLAANIDYTVRR